MKNDFLNTVTELFDTHGVAYYTTITPKLPTTIYINYVASNEDGLDFCVNWLNNLPSNIEKTLNIDDILEASTRNKNLYVVDFGYWDKESKTLIKLYTYEQFYTDDEFEKLKASMTRITKGDYEPYE